MALAEKNIMWKKLFRRITLILLVAAIPLCFNSGGVVAGKEPAPPGLPDPEPDGCRVERGQNPLDVLSVGIRHNVWFVLDSSGSMGGGFPGFTSKMEAAKELMKLLIAEFVDASGAPLVNWGYFPYTEKNNRNKSCQPDDQKPPTVPFGTPLSGMDPNTPSINLDDDQNGFMDHPGDCGFDLQNEVWPILSACGGGNNTQDIIIAIDATTRNGGTPLGITFDRVGTYIEDGKWVENLEPGQKNFIIHMTDGRDDCECRDFQYETGGTAVQLMESSLNPGLSPVSTDDKDIRTFNAALKGEKTLKQIDPTLDGSKGDIFMVGMGLDNAHMEATNHIAWMASGARLAGRPRELMRPAFFFNNLDEALDVFRDIFGVISTPVAEISMGPSLVASVKELIPRIPIDGEPAVTADEILAARVSGVLDSDDTNEARKIRNKFRNNVLFTTSVETPDFKGHLKAWNVYKVLNVDDDNDGEKDRVGDFGQFNGEQPLWDAGEVLRDTHPDDRTLLFNRLGDAPRTSPVLFDTNNVTAADLGVSGGGFLPQFTSDGLGVSEADAVEIIVKTIRGWRLVIDPVTGEISSPPQFESVDEGGSLGTWKLFDSSNAAPAVALNPPRSADTDAPSLHGEEYGSAFPDGFFWDFINRITVVHLGSNGGIMHAFRGDNGAELYGYIPGDVLPKLKRLVELLVNRLNGTINHEFFIDSSATLEDAFLDDGVQDPAWHSLLAFGRGRGGKFYTVLDITNAPDWDGNTANIDALNPADPTHHPILRFTVGNNDGVVDPDVGGGVSNYDSFGETWSVPVMGPVKTGSGNQWVLFAGSGYGCDGSNEGRVFYVLKVEDGSIYRVFDPIGNDATAQITHNAMIAWPTIFNPHEAGEDDNQDFVTRAYIGDLQGNIHKLECSNTDPDQWTFNVFYSLGANQPISAPIAIMNQKNANRILVFVGTGGDSRVTLPADEFFVFAGFIDSDIDGSNTQGTPITDPASGDDFILDLPEGEQVFVAPVVASSVDGGDGTVFFATTKPQINADCEFEFTSTLFAFDATTGLGAFDLEPATDGTQSSTDLGTQKVTGLYFRDEHLYVSQSGGIDAQAQTTVLGNNDFSSSDKSGGLGGGGGAIIRILTWNYRLSPF